MLPNPRSGLSFSAPQESELVSFSEALKGQSGSLQLQTMDSVSSLSSVTCANNLLSSEVRRVESRAGVKFCRTYQESTALETLSCYSFGFLPGGVPISQLTQLLIACLPAHESGANCSLFWNSFARNCSNLNLLRSLFLLYSFLWYAIS